MEHSAPRSPFTTGNMLVTLGGVLIVTGIFILISASWQSFTPTGRIITVTLPLILLYLISFMSWGKAAYQRYAHYVLLTASIILPFVIGVVLYQTGIYATVDWRLALYCSLLSLPVYIACETALRQEEQSVFITLATVVAALAYCITVNVPVHGYSFVGIIVGLVLLGAGAWLIKAGSGEESRLYTLAGYGLFWLGVLTWPLLYYFFLQEKMGFYSDPPSRLWLSLGLAVSALVILASGIFYSYLWQNNKSSQTLLDVRRLAENTAAVFLCIPATVVALSSKESAHALIALLLGVITLVFSYFIRVKSFRLLGYVAIVASLLRLLFFALSQLSAFWPILLLAGGFILIGLAYLLTHLQNRALFKWLWKEPDATLFGLGIEPPQEKKEPSALSGIVGTSPSPSRDTGWQWLLLIIVILLLLAFL